MAFIRVKKGEKNSKYLFHEDKYYQKVSSPTEEVKKYASTPAEANLYEVTPDEVDKACTLETPLDEPTAQTYTINTVWSNGYDVFLAQVDSLGVRIGEVILVNSNADYRKDSSPHVFGMNNGNIVVVWEMNAYTSVKDDYASQCTEIFAKIYDSTLTVVKETFQVSRNQFFDVWGTHAELTRSETGGIKFTDPYANQYYTPTGFAGKDVSKLIIKQSNPYGLCFDDDSFMVIWDNYTNFYYPSPNNQYSFIPPNMRKVVCYSYFDSSGNLVTMWDQYSSVVFPAVDGVKYDVWMWEPTAALALDGNVYYCCTSVDKATGNNKTNISYGVLGMSDYAGAESPFFVNPNLQLESYTHYDSHTPAVCALNNSPNYWVASWTTETYNFDDEFRQSPSTTNMMGDSAAVLRQVMTVWPGINLTDDWIVPYPEAPTQSGIQANVYWKNHQRYCDVKGTANGGFIMVWQSLNQDGSGYGIYARIFNHLSYPMSHEIPVAQSVINNQYRPNVTTLPDGNFMVQWASGDSETNNSIKGRMYTEMGKPLGNEFYVVDATAQSETETLVNDVDKGIGNTQKVRSCIASYNLFVWNG